MSVAWLMSALDNQTLHYYCNTLHIAYQLGKCLHIGPAFQRIHKMLT